MIDQKHQNPTTLLWVDLEMTGLRPQTDRIIEVAAVATDWDFNELGTFESGVRQDLKLIDDFAWLRAQPALYKELRELSAAAPPEAEVQEKFVKFIDQYVPGGEVALLAGNSIHQDRQFIRAWWPQVEARLHYRMLDVSAWKVVMLGKYQLEYPKKEAHRALGDIRESIAELKFYLNKAKF